MKNQFYENDRQKRKEAYLMAKGDPWLLWRLQAFRAGYIPPLLPGQIPRDLVGVPLGPPDEYHAEDLVKHANRVKIREKNYIAKTLTILIVTLSLLLSIGLFYHFKTGRKYRIPIIESMIPRAQSTHTQAR